MKVKNYKKEVSADGKEVTIFCEANNCLITVNQVQGKDAIVLINGEAIINKRIANSVADDLLGLEKRILTEKNLKHDMDLLNKVRGEERDEFLFSEIE